MNQIPLSQSLNSGIFFENILAQKHGLRISMSGGVDNSNAKKINPHADRIVKTIV
jgi:hypothetical protein